MFKKFKTILTKKQLNVFYLFIFLSFIAMLLETIGIGLIIPFVQVFISDTIHPKILEFLNAFGIFPNSKTDLVFILVLVLGLVYTLKAIFLTYVSYAQFKLFADTRVALSNRLYNIYLNKPFHFHLNNHSSKLIRNINEMELVVEVLRCSILLINETVVFLGISAFVILYEPMGSLIVILFLGSFGYLFYKKVITKAKEWGITRQSHMGLNLKFLQEGFGAIKEIKLLQRTNEIVKNFSLNNKITNFCWFKEKFVDSLPRLWLEWLAISGFILLILLMIFQGKELSYIVPLLGLFAAAAFRIMPSITRIMNSVQSILYNRPTVDAVYEEFNEKNFKDDDIKLLKPVSLNKEIFIKNLDFKYTDSGPYILRNINLNIQYGSTIGLIGESGIGKTTLINIILGLLKPTNGTIKVDNIDIFQNIRSWQSQIGYVPQNIYLTDDSIKKNVAFAIPEEKINTNAVNKAIVNAKLEGLVSNLKNGIDTKVGEFGDRISGGQRQRIAIARALYIDPKVLILDECTNALDSTTEKNILNEVNSLKGKKTIIMIAHRLSTLENCDHIYKIDQEGFKIQKG